MDCKIFSKLNLLKLTYSIIISGFVILISAGNLKAQNGTTLVVRDFIRENWKNAIHTNTADSGTLIGLPKPYSVPGTGGAFQEMYYWDTYFTNVGLITDELVVQAKNNVENILYLVEKYGFMPNGNRTFFLVRSQPPYLSMMIRDLYEYTGDKRWLEKVLPVLEKEYCFWMEQRMTPVGLNRYGEMADDRRKLSMFALADKRLHITKKLTSLTDSMKKVYGGHLIAECESGWDFTPRFEMKCLEYCPVDLNANLYMYEKNFAYFCKELGMPGIKKWEDAALKRKQLFKRYNFNPVDGLYYDYNYTTSTTSGVLSAAVFNVLWSGLGDAAAAASIQNNLFRLEERFGIVACEKAGQEARYQWDYPNGWANLQYVAVKGLYKYGYKQDAVRIAKKFTGMVTDNFLRTGNIWEKYNMQDGSLNVNSEYKLPSMMGWTAGVYSSFMDFIENEL
ncbi:MAG: trehalase family glycosidase [Niabella sp.]